MVSNNKNNRWVSIWLAVGVVILMVQVLLGGITRLTGSGLSITEWQPLLGALPPMNDQAWMKSFEKYQQIAQFKKLNSHFALADYQAIFFWEWLHREWARFMGLVFIVPFIFFLIKKKISDKMKGPLIILFLLGGLQGGIGWLMVQSGLNDTDVAVSHIRLAIHFVCALFLLSYLLWFALNVGMAARKSVGFNRPNRLLQLLLGLVFCQLTYGAFMAGTHAALQAPTWPDINGSIIPPGLFTSRSIIYDLLYNPMMIQFIHRGLAYIVAILIIIFFYQSGKLSLRMPLRQFRWVPFLLVIAQVILGILALINSIFRSGIYLSVLHQFVGMLLLMSLVTANFLAKARSATCTTTSKIKI
ncbi:COX15/CtaA family protein [Mucilaginibacter flavidus]|uniref:COX15/CtaA family protein n=1 Tax=Mucilaginibacter flavidus TaxID=2949309 RepID=UPI00209231CD|nr:COX15/CtaA family protein [Mucilaginibacter flavidus]MCO5947962.1 COX15/CtaA family protein [Mucilaginibacter flavidus]